MIRVIVYLCFGIHVLILAEILNNYVNYSINNTKHSSKTNGKELEVIFKTISSDLPVIEQLIQGSRALIKYIFTNYDFSQSGVTKLSDLLMESGGNPLRHIIVSTWRSGTTFLGDILNAYPGTYYNYEPLLKFGVKQIRGPPESIQVLNMITNMLKCNHTNMDDYFKFGKNIALQYTHNKRLWLFCERKRNLCNDANFISRFCKLFPFQLTKFVRLRLQVANELLRDEQLNVKIILLIRDPRAVMLSRQQQNFCNHLPADCSDPGFLCNDMISDYVEASYALKKQFSDRLLVLRFEELALEPNKTTQDILKFLKLSPAMPVQKFLETHTKSDLGNQFSTFRASSDVPFKWKDTLNFTDVDTIQKACSKAMSLWGYQMAHNATHMGSKEFNPLLYTHKLSISNR